MSEAFGRGVLAGYGIAIPVGAIAVLIVTTAARQSFRVGLAAGLGAATADMTYATIAVVAGSGLNGELHGLRTPLHALGGGVLLVVALLGLRGALRWRQTDAEPPATRRSRTYVRFLAITLINPLTVIYFSSVVLGSQTATAPGRAAAFVAGVALASASWQTLLATSGALAGRALVDRGHLIISIIGYGVVLVLAVAQLQRV